MKLRPYQEKGISDIRALFRQGRRKVCYAAPTGSGKTILFVHLAHRITEKGQCVAIIVHRQELIDQTCRALEVEGLSYGVVAAGYAENLDASVQVCMAQTVINRLERVSGVQVLIVDEAHHVMAATWLTILGALPQAWVLGVTATPERLDGKGLTAVFDALVIGPTVKELIAGGWLSPFVVYAPERLVDLKGARTVAGDYAIGDLAQRMSAELVLDDAVTEYRRRLSGRSAIAFCTTIAHSYLVARRFRAAGIRAQHLDGDTPSAERRRLIEALATGEVQIITNCGLIAEGLDIPSVAGVILLRPTKSLALHLQQIGRALRPAPGKARAVILDHAGNVFRHGMPDLEHPWSLEGRPKKRGKALVRRCPECGALIPIAARWCPECNADLRPEPVAPATAPDPLIELDPTTAHERWLATGPFQAVTRWAGSDETRLRAVARARGYKPGWVYYRLKAERDAADNAVLATMWPDDF
jgi:superfamily II DNA or RNA helicase